MKQAAKNIIGKNIGAKQFAVALCALLFLPLFVSASIVFLKIPTNKNQNVAWHQLAKIDPTVDTVILGDSAAGFAVDARLFSELTHTKAVNLAVTGAFGIQGTVMMLAQAQKMYPNLRHAYFIVSTMTWQQELSDEAYYLLREGLPPEADPLREIEEVKAARKRYINWLFTPERLVWAWDNKNASPYKQGQWNVANDYMIQNKPEDEQNARERWDVHMKRPDGDYLRPYLEQWAKLCGKVSCILTSAPMYKDFIDESQDSVITIQNVVDKNLAASLAFYDREAYPVAYEMLGDFMCHIRPEYKDEATRHYADIFLKVGGNEK
jgi:hypothetical protein